MGFTGRAPLSLRQIAQPNLKISYRDSHCFCANYLLEVVSETYRYSQVISVFIELVY